MNAIILNTKRALKLSFVTVLLISGSLIVRAAGNERHNEPKENHPGSANTAEVKYIGTHEGAPLFNVVYNNVTGARFSLKVTDEQGSQIFQSFYPGKQFDKKFQVINAQDYGKLIFIIRNMEDGSVQRFEVDSDTRMVEDVEVKEVK